MLEKMIDAEKKKVIRRIGELLTPHMWASGYRTYDGDKARPLKMWVPVDKNEDPTRRTYKLRGGLVVKEYEGFTDGGVITDSLCGGLSITAFELVPIEDLLKLVKFVEKQFPAGDAAAN